MAACLKWVTQSLAPQARTIEQKRLEEMEKVWKEEQEKLLSKA